jgi:hypothetical protein
MTIMTSSPPPSSSSSTTTTTTTSPFTSERKETWNVKLFYIMPWGLTTKFQD